MAHGATDIGTLDVEIGRARDWTFTLKTPNGLPVPLTESDKIVFTVTAAVGDAAALFSRSNTAGGGSAAEVELLDGPGGRFKVKALEANTALLPVGVLAPFECAYELASDGKDRTAFTGKLKGSRVAGGAI